MELKREAVRPGGQHPIPGEKPGVPKKSGEAAPKGRIKKYELAKCLREKTPRDLCYFRVL